MMNNLPKQSAFSKWQRQNSYLGRSTPEPLFLNCYPVWPLLAHILCVDLISFLLGVGLFWCLGSVCIPIQESCHSVSQVVVQFCIPVGSPSRIPPPSFSVFFLLRHMQPFPGLLKLRQLEIHSFSLFKSFASFTGTLKYTLISIHFCNRTTSQTLESRRVLPAPANSSKRQNVLSL